jgi:hypothetical protein
MIDNGNAQRLASEWHGGQWTRLYALASAGTPVLWTDRCVESEVLMCLCEIRESMTPPILTTDHDDLTSLAEWVEEWFAGNSCPCAECTVSSDLTVKENV